MAGAAWTAEEDTTLIANQFACLTDLLRLLPDRSEQGILRRIQHMVARDIIQRRRDEWTPEQDRQLLTLYPFMKVPKIAEHLQRSINSVKGRVQKLRGFIEMMEAGVVLDNLPLSSTPPRRRTLGPGQTRSWPDLGPHAFQDIRFRPFQVHQDAALLEFVG